MRASSIRERARSEKPASAPAFSIPPHLSPDDYLRLEGFDIRHELGPASAPFGVGATQRKRPFDRIVIHYTQSHTTAEAIKRYGHRRDEARGGSFGYHFLVDPSGGLWQVAPLSVRTNHVKGDGDGASYRNENSIGVSMIAAGKSGGRYEPTAEQERAALEFVPALARHFDISRDRIKGHGEVQSNKSRYEGASTARALRGLASSVSTLPRAAAAAVELSEFLQPGKAKPLTDLEISEAAGEIGCQPAALKAVIEVESSGKGFANGLPIIRPELDVFHKRTNGRFRGAKFPTLTSSQSRRYDLFGIMLARDYGAALASTSYGLGQVMGFNAEFIGLESAEQLFTEAKESEAKQLSHMIAFIRARGLDGHLRAQDWAQFAHGYNGADYAKTDYAGKLARAYLRLSGSASWAILRFGAQGEAVKRLQAALAEAGHACGDDGHFGAETEAALRAFQGAHGLRVDGIAAASTWTALKTAKKDKVTAPKPPPKPEKPVDEALKLLSPGSGALGGAIAMSKSGAEVWDIVAILGLISVIAAGIYLWRRRYD